MPPEKDDLASALLAGGAERDPQRLARGPARQLPKRFYERAEAAMVAGGFAVLLDGKIVKTPAKAPLALPTRALAEALAAEWAGQGAAIDSATMPLTRLANAAIDGVAGQMAEVEADAVRYAGSDLICYRAGAPERLALAQGAAWDGLIDFAREKLGARLVLTEGVMFAAQPETAVAAMAGAVRAHIGGDEGAAFRLAALHIMTTLTGSLVIALAVALREIEVEEAWAAAHVDEDFQMTGWGADPEALARREMRFADIRAAALLSRVVTPTA